MTWNLVEVIGYAGSVLVALSLMMNSLVRLRWINLAGALFFAVYGLLVGAYPVLVVNGFIVLVNVWYLVRMARAREYFTQVKLAYADNAYLLEFLDFHYKDIGRFFPDFDLAALKDPHIVFILRNMNPAGVVVYTQADGAAHIHLDYALPPYRDLRTGRFFLDQWVPRWCEEGICRLTCRDQAGQHGSYLQKLGFQAVEGGDPGIFEFRACESSYCKNAE